jgi:hypothetical protein
MAAGGRASRGYTGLGYRVGTTASRAKWAEAGFSRKEIGKMGERSGPAPRSWTKAT